MRRALCMRRCCNRSSDCRGRGMRSTVKTPWPQAVEVTPLSDFQLRVLMHDWRTLILDLADLIARRDAYWRLRQYRYFRQAAVDELGGIYWPEGDDLYPDGLGRYRVDF
ncbi:DUF2442 domain-containing protein [Desulfonatronum thiodismutans]|uniref:DUF2442 domain-containing protein n=1 Tax=Desulfonatronum thiodismutans TaxID=159290 RepID=UPI0038992192